MTKANWRWVGLGLSLVLVSGTPADAQPAKAAPVQPAKAAPARPAKAGARKGGDISADVTALMSADVEVAARAAETLGASDVPAAHDALLDALALGLHASVAVPVINALAVHPAPLDVAALKRYAGHHSPSVRSTALTALAMYPDPGAHAAVVAGLHDPVGIVRGAAATGAGRGRVREAVEPMLQLLARGEESSARSLAQLADADLARKIADQLGKVPDPTLALCLGAILKRADFGPDPARVEVVRSIAKIQDASAVTVLTEYLDTTPKNPPRASRREAELVVEARLGGK
jgi:HEAT repeat protein